MMVLILYMPRIEIIKPPVMSTDYKIFHDKTRIDPGIIVLMSYRHVYITIYHIEENFEGGKFGEKSPTF